MKNCATYSDEGISIENCKKINFIYGANGSGKSTIGRYLHDKNSPVYSNCSLDYIGDKDLEVIVYNKEFKSRNIVENIDGVFTLGEATIEDINKLEQMKEELKISQQELVKRKESLAKKEQECDSLNTDYQNSIWDEILRNNEEDFKEVFSGYRSNKIKFQSFVTEQYLTMKDSVSNPNDVSRENLLSRYNILFSNNLQQCVLIENKIEELLIEFKTIEDNVLWQEVIVGNNDLPISKLINQLQNADWVNKGRTFIREDSVCPFCQSPTITETFTEQLTEFFSGEYEAKIDKIQSKRKKYAELKEQIKLNIGNILSNNSQIRIGKIDALVLDSVLKTIETVIERNIVLMLNKETEPSSKVDLGKSNLEIKKIVEIIKNANTNISTNNQLIKNKESEKKKLITEVRLYLLRNYNKLISTHLSKIAACSKGVEGIKKSIKLSSDDLKIKSEAIIEAGKNITSVQPTVNEINRLLKAYGFTNFQIVPSKNDEHKYQIRRPDGSLANHTLSEGEETFISFLYFMQFAKGSVDKDKISNRKIMILDDPISSLDSTILYIVSSMVKSLIAQIRENSSDIDQLFVLTHNVFFHKEASFIDGRSVEFKDINFWIVYKNNDVSEVRSYEMKNPIKTTYELLWQGLRDDTDVSLVTVQNTMRRILENYFGIMGKSINDNIVESFRTVEEKIICRSLISWINDGSHTIADDLHICNDNDLVPRYKEIFRQIFANMKHEEHYKMMMKIEDDIESLGEEY